MTFRRWLQEKWYEHLEELDAYHITPETSARVYFNKYKWWLRRQYKIEEDCGANEKPQSSVGDKDHWIDRMENENDD